MCLIISSFSCSLLFLELLLLECQTFWKSLMILFYFLFSVSLSFCCDLWEISSTIIVPLIKILKTAIIFFISESSFLILKIFFFKKILLFFCRCDISFFYEVIFFLKFFPSYNLFLTTCFCLSLPLLPLSLSLSLYVTSNISCT